MDFEGKEPRAEHDKGSDEARLDSADYQTVAQLVANYGEDRTLKPRSETDPRVLAPAVKLTRSRLILLIAGVGIILILAVGATIVVFRAKSRTSNPAPNPNLRTTGPILPTTSLRPEMARIPGGTFQMGRNDGSLTEGPAHKVTVASFYMDKTEITNAEYAQFVQESNYKPPENWSEMKLIVGQEQLPVGNVTVEDARAFAAWRSKRDKVKYRLPTEEEWEYAARNGDRSDLYPWGNTWQPGLAATQEAGIGKEQPVGSYPQGSNVWGVLDLIGNVWEWTASPGSLYPGGSLGSTAFPQKFKDWNVARGGSYSSQSSRLSATTRDWFPPNYKNQVLGFRLVRDGP